MRTLVIQVDKVGADGGYPVGLLVDDGDGRGPRPGGQGRLACPLPVPPFAAQPGRTVDQLAREAVLGAYEPGAGVLDEIGGYLHGLLAGSGIGAAWQEAAAVPAGEVLTILDVRAPELRRLPWELLRSADRWLFTDPDAGFVRGRYPFPDAACAELVPIRMLIVVGSVDEKLEADAELAAIHAGITRCPGGFRAALAGRFHTEILRAPSRSTFFEAVEQLRPHVFHFVGHGHYSPGTSMPMLELREPGAAQPWELTGDEVRHAFPGWKPRLVMLNACRTAESDAQAGVIGLAEAFSERSAAVVCMQGLVPADAAVRFTGAFYSALSTGVPMDRAVATGRGAVWQGDPAGMHNRSWALPTLDLRVPPADVLPTKAGMPDADLLALDGVPEFNRMRHFVDRGPERRELWWQLDPVDGRPGRPLVVVTGRNRPGRSDLVFSCLMTCAVRGRQVRHLDLDYGTGRVPWLDVLYRIRDGSGHSLLRSALPAAAFADFNRDVVDLATGRYPDPDRPPPGQLAPRPDFTVQSEHTPEFIERVFASFRDALRRAAADRPLIIAVDHLLNRVAPEDVTHRLCPLLFQPIAAGEVPSVRMVIELRDEERDLLTREVRELAHVVQVKGFRRDMFALLHREYWARAGLSGDAWPMWERVVEANLGVAPETWYPVELIAFRRHLERAGVA